jgi:hypothetical protein
MTKSNPFVRFLRKDAGCCTFEFPAARGCTMGYGSVKVLIQTPKGGEQFLSGMPIPQIR